jgi:three-Cys-motif partner protein
MTADTFFDHQSPESATKTDIVANFFPAWLNIIGRTARGSLAYMELFAGPGKYADGTKSTPILVLESILASPHSSRFRVVLNEMKSRAADLLEANVKALPGIDRLREPPIIRREEIDREKAISFLHYLDNFPAVLFVDPFGYKGVSRQLFAQFMRGGWGRDAILFFNYKRINAALSNPEFTEHMEAIFGADRAATLWDTLAPLQSEEREQHVHAALEEAFHEAGVNFIQRYDFEKRHDSLVFMSQSEKGLRVMKTVMQKRSRSDDDGVPSFSFARPAPRQMNLQLFGPQRSQLDDLRDSLLTAFDGRTVTFEELVREHHPGTRYVDRNYRQVLLEMESRSEITTSPSKRRTGTFGPNVKITFPRKG